MTRGLEISSISGEVHGNFVASLSAGRGSSPHPCSLFPDRVCGADSPLKSPKAGLSALHRHGSAGGEDKGYFACGAGGAGSNPVARIVLV